MQSPNDTTSPPTLPYAPIDHARRLRKLVLRSVLAVAIVALTAASYIHRSDISTRARRWYWARQCANHVTPPGTKLVISDPFGPRPMAGNPDYISWSHAPKESTFYSPRAWREFAPLSRVIDRKLAAAPVAFLGEVRMTAGERSTRPWVPTTSFPSSSDNPPFAERAVRLPCHGRGCAVSILRFRLRRLKRAVRAPWSVSSCV